MIDARPRPSPPESSRVDERAANCPSHALSDGEPDTSRNVPLWPTHVERCCGYWRAVGTDCGVCMAVCPFSHPDTPLHRAVRAALRRAPWLARVASGATTGCTDAPGGNGVDG